MKKNRKFYNSSIHSDLTPVFETQRISIVNYKTFQRSQFPLTPASGKTVYKAEGATVDRVVVDLSQKDRKYKMPHMFLCIKSDQTKPKSHLTMLDPCINISRMLNLNQMCWQQM